jgi:hypothetical protein
MDELFLMIEIIFSMAVSKPISERTSKDACPNKK